MSTNLALDGQAGWLRWFNPSDSPEGAYLGTIRETQTSIDATVPLGRVLTPGRYYVAIKVLTYGANGRLEIMPGAGSTEVTNVSGGGFTGIWTLPATVDIAATASTIAFRFHRTQPLGVRQLYLFKGLYITDVTNNVVDARDHVLNLDYPQGLDPTPHLKGNILENSSFEVGTGHGWGLVEASTRTYPLRSLWDDSQAHDGEASLKVPRFEYIVSRNYTLRPNRKHTLSAWVRGSSSSSVVLTIENATELPDEFPPSVVVSETFGGLGSDWQRIDLSADLLDYPTSDYRIRIVVNDPVVGHVWLDAVQLEEGELTEYAPKNAVEIGLLSDAPSNIFFDDEPATMRLRSYNGGNSSVNIQINYEIYDYWNEKVRSGMIATAVVANDTSEQPLDLATGKRGIFRIVLYVNGVDGSQEEVVYSILPRPQVAGADEASLIGIHPNFTDFQLSALQKMGIKWASTTSPSRVFRWSTLEPTPGDFRWLDHEVAAADRNGIRILGTLGGDWPAWANAGGVPNLQSWSNYVFMVVNRYKGSVKYWQVWNEPNYVFSPAFYAELLKAAVAAARLADPQCRILGMGGNPIPSWVTDVINSLGTNWASYMDQISAHVYPQADVRFYGEFKTNVVDRYQMAVWGTEAGVWDRGSYQGLNSSFIQYEDYIWSHTDSARYQTAAKGAPELVSYSFLHTIGTGLSKYFYYDARIFSGPATPFTHPTIFEYDDGIRAKGVVLAILARLFDHSVGLGNISPNTNSYFYLFNRGGVPLVALWSADMLTRSVTTTLLPAQFRIYDIMGNQAEVTDSTVRYTGSPLYVEGVGINVDALRAAFSSGVISNQMDTNAPNLSLLEAPTGPGEESSVRFRWIAIDDSRVPSDLTPEVIQYSYRLGGHDTTSSPWSARAHVSYTDLAAGSYEFMVQARDASGNLSEVIRSALTIVSPGSSNTPPVIAQISDQTVHAGASIVLNVMATDPDQPPNTLTYSIASGPAGALISSSSGQFSWTPAPGLAGTTNAVTVRVRDNGIPPLEAVRSFTIYVVEPPKILAITLGNNIVDLLWSAVPGNRYQLEYSEAIAPASWNPVSGEVVASGTTATKQDSLLGGSTRFYRIRHVQ